MKNVSRLRGFFLIIAVMILSFGCRKNEENDKPVITITSPIENSMYQVLDTIIVSFEVIDDDEVQRVEISLVDENFAIVDQTIQFPVNSIQGTFNKTYIPSNLDLISGTYYIEVKAFDNEQEKREYVKISLNEYPLVWEGLLVVKDDGTIGKIDINNQYTDLWNLPFPYRHGDIDNRNKSFYVGNDENGKLVALDLNSGLLKWQGPIYGSPSSEYFNDIIYDNEKLLIVYASEEHEIRKFTSNGIEKTSIAVGVDNEVEKLFEMGDYTFAEVNSTFVNQNHFQVYFSQTGFLQQNELFNGDVIEISRFNDNELLILGNDANNNGFLSFYDVSSNAFDNYTLFNEPGVSMQIIDQQKIVTSLESALYQYDFGSNQLVLLESLQGFDKMIHESINNILFCLKGNTIYYYQASPWTYLGQLSVTGEVKDIFNLYNK